MDRYDVIVLGTGGVGSAALFHLALRGARALGIDRFPPGHDRGSSHGQTRIIRQVYFEHPDYVPLVRRSFELWHDLEQRRGERLFFPTGLLQIGPPEGDVLRGVRASARRHGLDVEEATARDIESRWPGLRCPAELGGVFERGAGYLLVDQCVVAHADEAVRLGAALHSVALHSGEAVLNWQPDQDGLVVHTDRDRYWCRQLIITAGPWSGPLLGQLGIPLRVLRKPVYWWQPSNDEYRADRGFPAFLYEVPTGMFYGVPAIDALGVKVAEHSGGSEVSDPLQVDRTSHPDDEQRIVEFNAAHLPGLTKVRTQFKVCLYTMTPDRHFVVDRHPRYDRVHFAAGLSGHGFKFAPVLGEALAQLALEGRSALSMDFLSLRRTDSQTADDAAQ